MPTAARRAVRAQQRQLKDGRWISTHPNVQHGTPDGYSSYLCRCPPCSAAWTEQQRADNATRRARTAAEGLPSTVRHRIYGYRNWGCPCSTCRAADREADRRRDRRGRYSKAKAGR